MSPSSPLSPAPWGEKKTRDNAVYVTGLSQDVTEESLAELFGSIGVIKVRRTAASVCVNVLHLVYRNIEGLCWNDPLNCNVIGVTLGINWNKLWLWAGYPLCPVMTPITS